MSKETTANIFIAKGTCLNCLPDGVEENKASQKWGMKIVLNKMVIFICRDCLAKFIKATYNAEEVVKLTEVKPHGK